MSKRIMSYLMQENQADDWDNMFFSEAVLWSRRSHDSETKCGCILVKNKTVISTGYNGFIRDIDDSAFPSHRPAKYPFMIHAEANAVYNAAREGKSTLGARAYITAIPCRNCLQMLWQTGIHEIYFSTLSAPRSSIWTEQYEEILNQLKDRIVFKYFPKKNLSNAVLVEAAEKFENFEKDG